MGFKIQRNDVINAHYFFVDIVGLSDTQMDAKTQTKKIRILNESIKECDSFKEALLKESPIVLPTGDGMCIGFMADPFSPLHLAIELQEKLKKYNIGKIPSETVLIRIGLNAGNCFLVDDIQGNKNVWGPGIILSRRVMDFGDDGHILLTNTYAESLLEMDYTYRKIVKQVHDFELKHGKTILVYSAHNEDFGNPKHPTKGAAIRSKLGGEDYLKYLQKTLYSNITVDLEMLDYEKQLVHHKRKYQISNKDIEPIRDVLHGIATDVDKYSIDDLNIKVSDEKGKEMKISSINVNLPMTKEFTTKFNNPIKKGEEGREYTLEYVVEEPERYFQNTFLIDCNELILSFSWDNTLNINEVILYEVVDPDTEEKIKLDISPTIKNEGKNTKATWKLKNAVKGQTFKIEW